MNENLNPAAISSRNLANKYVMLASLIVAGVLGGISIFTLLNEYSTQQLPVDQKESAPQQQEQTSEPIIEEPQAAGIIEPYTGEIADPPTITGLPSSVKLVLLDYEHTQFSKYDLSTHKRTKMDVAVPEGQSVDSFTASNESVAYLSCNSSKDICSINKHNLKTDSVKSIEVYIDANSELYMSGVSPNQNYALYVERKLVEEEETLELHHVNLNSKNKDKVILDWSVQDLRSDTETLCSTIVFSPTGEYFVGCFNSEFASTIHGDLYIYQANGHLIKRIKSSSDYDLSKSVLGPVFIADELVTYRTEGLNVNSNWGFDFVTNTKSILSNIIRIPSTYDMHDYHSGNRVISSYVGEYGEKAFLVFHEGKMKKTKISFDDTSILSAKFVPDTERILALTDDGRFVLWDAAEDKLDLLRTRVGGFQIL